MGIISGLINRAINTAILPFSVTHDICNKIMGEDSEHTEDRIIKIITGKGPED